ncbi:MAG: GtrA family protein [Acidimicrobiales bacterium]
MTDTDPGPAPGAPRVAGLVEIWRADEALVRRLVQVVRHPSSLKVAKYASVSVISTVVSQVTLLLTFGVFRVMSEVPANILANVVATVPSYYLNRSWVWGKNGKSHVWREVVPFWVLSFVGLAFSSVAVWLAGDVARDHHLHHFGTTVLVNGANLMSFAILWVVKFVIYQKLFHVTPIEHPPAEEQELVDA